jgi:hypothetical protein
MSLLGKIQKKLVEFSRAPDKGAWVYDPIWTASTESRRPANRRQGRRP